MAGSSDRLNYSVRHERLLILGAFVLMLNINTHSVCVHASPKTDGRAMRQSVPLTLAQRTPIDECSVTAIIY